MALGDQRGLGRPPISIPAPADALDSAIVIRRFESGGFSLLGIQFGSVDHTVTVQFYAEPGCFEEVAAGEPWPPATAGCETPGGVKGVVSGGGTAPTGESIIFVDVAVTADCYDFIQARGRLVGPRRSLFRMTFHRSPLWLDA